jgi:hypothetical protein
MAVYHRRRLVTIPLSKASPSSVLYRMHLWAVVGEDWGGGIAVLSGPSTAHRRGRGPIFGRLVGCIAGS